MPPQYDIQNNQDKRKESNFRTIMIFVLLGILVICLGGLAGWYLVLRTRTESTNAADAARGFGTAAPTADANGSTFANNGTVGAGIGGTTGIQGQTGNTNTETGAGITSNGTTNTADGSNTGEIALDANGRPIGTSTTSANTSNPVNRQAAPKTPRLWHLDKTPVAGFEFGAANSNIIYYAERATGYVFRANILTGEITRLTNTLTPKTYSAQFARNGGAILRSLDDKTGSIITFSGTIATSTTALSTLTGVNLENNILDIDHDPDSRTLFFTRKDAGNTIGFTSSWNGSREKRIFTSTLGSWKPILLNDGRMFVTQKPHDGVSGYAYQVATDGTLVPLLRAAPGLTVLPLSNSGALLYGTSVGGALNMYLQASSTNSTVTLPLKTIADKCIWSPYTPASRGRSASPLIAYCAVPNSIDSVQFLRDWYMGALHTADSWWRISATGETTRINAGMQGLDVLNPVIDPTGSFLAFNNAADGSLWVLRIAQ